MTNLIIQVSKYLIIILMALYTFQCFTVFQKKDDEAREYLFLRQNMLMFAMHFVAYTVLYLEKPELSVLLFYGAQVIYLAAVLVLFRNLYPLASKLLINNMCMLITVGFIMITRLKYDSGVKQFKIAVIATVVALLIPVIIRKLRFITKMYWLYALMGIGLLGLVAIAATVTYGAKLSFTVGGISIQPSEFVKIIYVFAIAGLLSNARDFRRIVIATGLAALHVLILVVSKDLGSAMIFFVTYLVMLFVSTRNPFLVLTGIFAGSGVGKSTLMGMFARNTKADINVIALIGERGREVREFVERDLGEEGMKRSVVVVATSDKPALIRNKAAKTATAIAEYFRDQGKDVLLMMDSLTRFSMAQREIGLASGEPPVTRGYPPSVYSEMPKLLERAGRSDKGSITGLYTVLVDGDDFNEPITDTARSILDGHIMLNRKLAHKNHYPAIDVMQSISRVMSAIVDDEHKAASGKLKNVLATYAEAEDLINIGAYKQGSNKNIDYAISKIEAVNEFLRQRTDEKFMFDEEVQLLEQLFEG